MIIAYIFLGLAMFIGLLRWVLKLGSSSPPYQPYQAQDSQTPASSTTPIAPAITPPIPTPTPAAPQKTNWGWVVAFGILAGVVVFWVVIPALKNPAPPPQVTTPKRELQKLRTSIDPLRFSREKSSRGIRIENNGGYYTIVLDPGQEIVFEFEVPREYSLNSNAPFLPLDFHRRTMENGYMGYRINNITHKNIFLTGDGLTTLIPRPQEFRPGKNELAIFSEKGQLRIDGDEQIIVREK